MPQGGLDKGEDPYEAALRELYEETSVKRRRACIGGSPGLVHLRPARSSWSRTSWNGQATAARSRNGSRSASRATTREIDVLNPGGGKHKPEFTAWRWEKLERAARS